MKSSDYQQALKHCELEPIHLSGAIQPHGVLIKITEQHIISHVSANVAQLLQLEPEQLLGQSVTKFEHLAPAYQAFFATKQRHQLQAGALKIEQWLDLCWQRVDDGVLLELEINQDRVDFRELNHNHLARLLHAPSQPSELAAFHDFVLQALYELTGYSRLLIYQFQPDWSGEVVAEKVESGLGTYLGLRYPASDIPEIVRKLYLKIAMRSIPNRDYQAVPIIAMDDAPIDLSQSRLRSVSPLHLEYMTNMGVMASFSLPIIYQKKLWGLVSGHHHEATAMPATMREQCKDWVRTYNVSLSSYFNGERLKLMDRMERLADTFLQILLTERDGLSALQNQGETVMALFDADGFAAIIDDEYACVGDTPTPQVLASLKQWLQEQPENWWSTDCLQCVFPEQPALLAVASGLLALRLDIQRLGKLRFFWFRSEQKQQITWAGNPNKPILEKAGAMMLSPRRSFEKWVEVKSGYARPWQERDHILATKMRAHLLRML
ncbi:MAG: GAF domain-containing protein [Methylococcales bacterium]|nr:GAF domain-containing protein [Methylococcales bacterium]